MTGAGTLVPSPTGALHLTFCTTISSCKSPGTVVSGSLSGVSAVPCQEGRTSYSIPLPGDGGDRATRRCIGDYGLVCRPTRSGCPCHGMRLWRQRSVKPVGPLGGLDAPLRGGMGVARPIDSTTFSPSGGASEITMKWCTTPNGRYFYICAPSFYYGD